jgi:hypothetical protein
LRAFGAAGLHCNLSKSSVSPIRCDNVDLQPILGVLSCAVGQFPVQYLGLPLSVTRLSKSDLQPLVDKVPTWKASLMKKSGRFDSLGLCSDGYLHLHHAVPGFTPVVLQAHRHAAEGFSGQPPRKLGEDSVWCRGRLCARRSR